MKTKIKLPTLAYILLLAFAFTHCSAQFYQTLPYTTVDGKYTAVIPNCCEQAIQLTKANAALADSLQRKQALLDTTRAVGNRIIAAQGERITTALKGGNTGLAKYNTLRDALYVYAIEPWNPFRSKKRWVRRVLASVE